MQLSRITTHTPHPTHPYIHSQWAVTCAADTFRHDPPPLPTPRRPASCVSLGIAYQRHPLHHHWPGPCRTPGSTAHPAPARQWGPPQKRRGGDWMKVQRSARPQRRPHGPVWLPEGPPWGWGTLHAQHGGGDWRHQGDSWGGKDNSGEACQERAPLQDTTAGWLPSTQACTQEGTHQHIHTMPCTHQHAHTPTTHQRAAGALP
jgi:hypothetical protein